MSEEKENQNSTKESIDKPILRPRGLMGMSPFLRACFDGDEEKVKELSGKGADINFRKIPPPDIDLDEDDLEKYFIGEQEEAKANHTGFNAIDICVQQDNIDILLYLVNNLGMSVTEESDRGYYPVHIAAENDSHQCLTYILESTGDTVVNLPGGKNQLTPLHIATQNNACGSIQILVKHGAAFDATDINGRKPIDYCTSEDTHSLFEANGVVDHEEELFEEPMLHFEEEERNEPPPRLETPEDVRLKAKQKEEHEKHIQEMLRTLFPHLEIMKKKEEEEKAKKAARIQARREQAAKAGQKKTVRTKPSKAYSEKTDNFNNETFMMHVHRQIVNNDGNVNTFLRTHKFDWWYGKDPDGKTALHLLAMKCKAKQFNPLLFSNPETLRIRDKKGKTALSYVLAAPRTPDQKKIFTYVLQYSEFFDEGMAREVIEYCEEPNNQYYMNQLRKMLPPNETTY